MGRVKSRKQLEADFQTDCLEILKNEIGGWWKKLHTGTYSRKGTPDIIGVRKGICYVLEVKIPDGTGVVDPLQDYNLRKVRENGGVAMKIESITELRELFRDS